MLSRGIWLLGFGNLCRNADQSNDSALAAQWQNTLTRLSKCPFFFWAKRHREPGSTRRAKRRETRAGLTLPLQKRLHTGSGGGGLFAQARHPNPLNSYAVLSSPSSPPTGLLSEAPRKMGHISKNTMMRGVSECLLTSYQSLHLDLFNPSFYLRPSVLNLRIILIHWLACLQATEFW